RGGDGHRDRHDRLLLPRAAIPGRDVDRLAAPGPPEPLPKREGPSADAWAVRVVAPLDARRVGEKDPVVALAQRDELPQVAARRLDVANLGRPDEARVVGGRLHAERKSGEIFAHGGGQPGRLLAFADGRILGGALERLPREIRGGAERPRDEDEEEKEFRYGS